MSIQKKRSKSLSLSESLIRKLNILWYEEVKKQLSMDERVSFSEFVEGLLWEAVKKRSEKTTTT